MLIFPFPRTVFREVNSRSSVLLTTESQHVNPPQDLGISGNCSLTTACTGLAYVITPADRNPTLDIVFDCQGTSSSGVSGQGIITVTTSFTAIYPNVDLDADEITLSTSILGTYIEGCGTSDGLIDLTISLKPDDAFIPTTRQVKKNWVQWSNIGSLSFTVGRDNVAGERPLDWSGYVYLLLKLGAKIVAYGQSGVSFLVPAGVNYGLQTIHRVGLKGPNCATGDNTKHLFIDADDKLWLLSESLTLLDYSEYLSALNANTVMSYDLGTNVVYICDGVHGFVYSVSDNSLGKCSPLITGVGYKNGTRYIAAAGSITTDPFEVCTDIYDLGTRAGKTIFRLEYGTDLTNGLYAAVDYRRSKSDDFVQTPWYAVPSSGIIHISAYGREFRFRTKLTSYEDFSLDYIKISGVANAY